MLGNLYHSVCRTRCVVWMACLFCMVSWFACFPGPVSAHKVTIFAWVEGDTVYTRSKFSGGKRAKNTTVVVYDEDGNQLLEGRTDEKGEFAFKVPEKTTLQVVLKASMGHLAEWTIPEEEISGVSPVPEPESVPGVAEKELPLDASSLGKAETGGKQPETAPASVGLSRRDLLTLIDESLDKKLAPIANMLVDSLDQGPKVSEVIGGIGYIFGLVGVALYFSNRGKGK